MKKTKELITTIISILLFIILIVYAFLVDNKAYINDSCLGIAIILILYFSYKKINLNLPIFISIIIAFLLHNFGVFGFYSHSPVQIQYDHITHFVGGFAIALLFFTYLKRFFSNSKFHNFVLLLVILFASLGIGALIEQVEYIGYLKMGEGEGFFYHGGLGDVGVNLRAMDKIGGGWINTMLDLMYNFYGALTGLILIHLIYKFKK